MVKKCVFCNIVKNGNNKVTFDKVKKLKFEKNVNK